MQGAKDIVVIMDLPEHAQVAFERARAIGHTYGAHLHLFSFAHHPMYEQKDAFESDQRAAIRREVTSERREWLRGFVRDARAAFADVTLKTIWTRDLAGWISDYAADHPCDLVVKTVHKSRTLLHTPSDWTLIRHCPAPLLLCAEREAVARPKVLATIDLNRDDAAHRRLNRRVLDVASRAATDGQLHCAYALELDVLPRSIMGRDRRELMKQAKVHAQEALAKLVAPWGVPKSRQHVVLGRADEALVGCAGATKADLMVVGTTARTGIRGLVIGNSAERILASASIDLLTVKP